MTPNAQKAPHGFHPHIEGQDDQQPRLRQRSHRLHLAMAVVMLVVGGFARHADCGIGHHGGAEIDQRMAGFRQDRERAGRNADRGLGDRHCRRSGNRGEGNSFFFALHWRVGVTQTRRNFDCAVCCCD